MRPENSPSEVTFKKGGYRKFVSRSYVGMVMGLSDIISLTDKEIIGGRLRNHLPEPFDYFDHAGNFAVSYIFGYVGNVAMESFLNQKTDVSSRVRRVATASAGFLAATSFNVITETTAGRLLGLRIDSSDFIDMWYGCIAGAVGASYNVQSTNNASTP